MEQRSGIGQEGSGSLVQSENGEKVQLDGGNMILENAETVEIPVKKPEKRRLFIIAAVVAVIALMIGIGFLSTGSSTERRLQKQLDLGEKYIDELEYEQAAVAFELAISIDEKCAEAYLGAAQAYEALGDTEKAMEFLETGYEKTGDASLQNEIERLRAEMALSEEGILESQGETSLQADMEESTTSEGNLIIFKSGYNAYQSFESLDANMQEFLKAALEDLKSVDDIMPFVDNQMQVGFPWQYLQDRTAFGFRTVCQDYKVQVEISIHDDGMCIHLEARPQNGKGIYAYYYTEGSYCSLEYGECSSIDWQLNGECTIYDKRGEENGATEFYYIYFVEVKNNVRVGTEYCQVVINYWEKVDWEKYESWYYDDEGYELLDGSRWNDYPSSAFGYVRPIDELTW